MKKTRTNLLLWIEILTWYVTNEKHKCQSLICHVSLLVYDERGTLLTPKSTVRNTRLQCPNTWHIFGTVCRRVKAPWLFSI